MASIPIHNETDYLLTHDMTQHILRDAQEHFGEGRVPDACGYSFEPSPKPPASSDATGHEPSNAVFNPSLAPLGLHLSTPSLSTA